MGGVYYIALLVIYQVMKLQCEYLRSPGFSRLAVRWTDGTENDNSLPFPYNADAAFTPSGTHQLIPETIKLHTQESQPLHPINFNKHQRIIKISRNDKGNQSTTADYPQLRSCKHYEEKLCIRACCESFKYICRKFKCTQSVKSEYGRPCQRYCKEYMRRINKYNGY